MNRSDSISNLGKALAKAQSKITTVKKDTTNPHFNRMYASLAAVNEAVMPMLTECGISVIQGVSTSQDMRSVGIGTTFIHGESGEWWTEELFLPVVKADPQGFGSAITYGRRYLLMAMAGIAPEDDDANEASKPSQQKQASVQKPPVSTEAKKEAQNPVMPAGKKAAEGEAVTTEGWNADPKTFMDVGSALKWGMDSKVFSHMNHCQNAYDKVKAEKKPETAAAMWAFWIQEVNDRVAASKLPQAA